MGMDLSIYLGIMIKLPLVNSKDTVEIKTCSDEECQMYLEDFSRRETEYCGYCGRKLEIIYCGRKLEIIDVKNELELSPINFMHMGKLISFNDDDFYEREVGKDVYLMPNTGEFNFYVTSDEEPRILEPKDISDMVLNFSIKYQHVINELSNFYGIEIKAEFGLIQYYS